MSDIDFDELDREVTKLVGGSTAPDTPQSDTPNSRDEVLPEKQENSISAITIKTDDEDTNSLPVTPSNAIARPRGRFMDVVHPSSDMAKEETPQEETKILDDRQVDAADRQSFATGRDDIAEEAPDDRVEDMNMGSEQENTKVSSEDVGPESVSATDMPDPIEVHQAIYSNNKDEQDESPQEELPSQKEEVPEVVNEDTSPPVASPFVADAKEEKRPLGQFSAIEKQASDEAIEKILSQESIPEGDDESSRQDTEYVLPPELEKDLVAIEAGESPDTILSGSEEHSASSSDNQKEVKAESAEKQGALQESARDDTTSASLLVSGSIPQQYKLAMTEKGETKDESDSQLFRAEHYATSPATKSSQKSKTTTIIQWVLIGAGIICLGVVLGIGVFTFVTSQ